MRKVLVLLLVAVAAPQLTSACLPLCEEAQRAELELTGFLASLEQAVDEGDLQGAGSLASRGSVTAQHLASQDARCLEKLGYRVGELEALGRDLVERGQELRTAPP